MDCLNIYKLIGRKELNDLRRLVKNQAFISEGKTASYAYF